MLFVFRGIAAVTHIRNERLFEKMCSRPDRILAASGLGAHGWGAATDSVALSVNRLTPYILHFIFVLFVVPCRCFAYASAHSFDFRM